MDINWEKGAPAPVGRCLHSAVWLNGVVYVGSGNEAGVGLSYNIDCYDPVNNSWGPPINTPNREFAMTALNNRLVIAGGQNKHFKRTNQLFIMVTGQLKYYTNMSTARSYAAATGHQGMLIITGGLDDNGKELSSTELLDTNNGQWYKCDDIPQPYHLLQSVIVDNILYLLGGRNKYYYDSPAVFTAPLNTLSRHQLKWSTNQDTPWCRSTPVGLNGTHLLILGGNKKIGHQFTRTSDISKLDKVTHSWKDMGNIPSARSSSAAVSTTYNRVIVIGGVNDKGDTTNTVWIGSCEPQ